MGPNLLLGAMAGAPSFTVLLPMTGCAWSMRIPSKVKQGCSSLANVGQIQTTAFYPVYITVYISYIYIYAYFSWWFLPSNWIQLEPGQEHCFEVGSVMNFSLPSWLILILLISILVHSAYKTFKKANGGAVYCNCSRDGKRGWRW